MFELDKRLAADCLEVGDLPLCRVLLMNDSQFPWLILVPRREGITEILELDAAEQQQLWAESNQVAQALTTLYQPDKLNIAAIGNVVSQLHVHHIARFQGDSLWPQPVWGKLPARPYADETALAAIAQIRQTLSL
ncbi:HIT domain-containing protein [Alteromonas aestuariivivens]|uniref:HIT domain-containing protein n=1 Tax=Alteromonas aestuariivivens TaxID=1938339 RepID=A0A3D8MBZ2_9ALTE|nr:HIT domain-containing protein [Alteromonas aestuariivivens]RDV27556.1 HIT domain-containing protein [Alteromonas aestuariivivens]